MAKSKIAILTVTCSGHGLRVEDPQHCSLSQLLPDCTPTHQRTTLAEVAESPVQLLGEPDGLLIELEVGLADAMVCLDQLAHYFAKPKCPVVVIGGNDAELAVKALKAGATDYLITERLSPQSLRRALGTAHSEPSSNPPLPLNVEHEAKHQDPQFEAGIQAHLQDFVESNVVGIIYCDIYGNIFSANDELLRTVGYTRTDLDAGHVNWTELTPSEFLPLDENGIAEAKARGACTPYEKEYIRKDGSRVPVLVGYSLLGQRREEAVAFVLDLSDRKQAQAEREQLLKQEQAARAEAERANRVKDEFLAVLSHELRSPLNPILGWAKLLQTQKLDKTKTARALETIERNAKLQTQLVDDLLDVAKILRGKLKLQQAPVPLVATIEAAIDTVKTAAEAKAITITTHLPNLGQTWGDSARIQQIVWNLLSNAVKFTPSQGHITVGLNQINDQAQITVVDTGQGIRPEFLPDVFESFRQEDVSITRQHGGLGLGLAIVRHLVEAHHGTITVKSEGEGKGATFTVQLPLMAAADDMAHDSTQTGDRANLTGLRILAVDDDSDSRELLEVLLSQHGASIVTVASAAAALAQITVFEPDILITDLGMPKMDGYVLLREVRALTANRGWQIPAIALTAYVRQEDQQRALAHGFQYHLAKPLDIELLVKTITELARPKLQAEG